MVLSYDKNKLFDTIKNYKYGELFSAQNSIKLVDQKVKEMKV